MPACPVSPVTSVGCACCNGFNAFCPYIAVKVEGTILARKTMGEMGLTWKPLPSTHAYTLVYGRAQPRVKSRKTVKAKILNVMEAMSDMNNIIYLFVPICFR